MVYYLKIVIQNQNHPVTLKWKWNGNGFEGLYMRTGIKAAMQTLAIPVCDTFIWDYFCECRIEQLFEYVFTSLFICRPTCFISAHEIYLLLYSQAKSSQQTGNLVNMPFLISSRQGNSDECREQVKYEAQEFYRNVGPVLLAQ